jgi:hypothetical protein
MVKWQLADERYGEAVVVDTEAGKRQVEDALWDAFRPSLLDDGNPYAMDEDTWRASVRAAWRAVDDE